MLIALVLGAAVVFVAGFQLGDQLDGSAVTEQLEEMSTEGEVAAAVGTDTKQEKFSFLDDLALPSEPRSVRKLARPKGNANNPPEVEAALQERARKKAAREERRKERLKKNAERKTVAKTKVGSSVARKVARKVETFDSMLGQTQGYTETVAKAAATKLPKIGAGNGALEKARTPRKKLSHTGRGRTYGSFAEARTALRKLRQQGMDPHMVLSENAQGEKVYKISVGKHASEADAELASQRAGGPGGADKL